MTNLEKWLCQRQHCVECLFDALGQSGFTFVHSRKIKMKSIITSATIQFAEIQFDCDRRKRKMWITKRRREREWELENGIAIVMPFILLSWLRTMRWIRISLWFVDISAWQIVWAVYIRWVCRFLCLLCLRREIELAKSWKCEYIKSIANYCVYHCCCCDGFTTFRHQSPVWWSLVHMLSTGLITKHIVDFCPHRVFFSFAKFKLSQSFNLPTEFTHKNPNSGDINNESVNNTNDLTINCI